MKILVKFDSSIGLDAVEKQLSANDTVENLEVLISLNFAEMNTCKLKYDNQTLTNKDAKLRDVFPISK